eukprot:NODE_1948_length_861_cov_267.038177_g1366_i0.p1 GENE.NODE_1948_length_861_cov_267.038177_g1366_i0~~NODE_1948_length_861_cov_267.038177_g1366_i0.p1  ORF type:complete len:231 (+),score=98.40 NODE_1948_length_861_cov_267.038177_g1366_i0:76-693(+)
MDRLNVGQRVGSGTFGEVYRVVITKNNQPAALKKIKCASLSEANQALEEAFLIKGYNHPNILRYRETFLHDEQGIMYVCLIMDYFPSQIASAIAFLHAAQILHRDLKPANILMSDRHTNIVIADFGLAKMIDKTLLSTAAGTPAYMSPEQVAGSYAAPADVWALGCIVHEMMSPGQPPKVMYMKIMMAGEARFHTTFRNDMASNG